MFFGKSSLLECMKSSSISTNKYNANSIYVTIFANSLRDVCVSLFHPFYFFVHICATYIEQHSSTDISNEIVVHSFKIALTETVLRINIWIETNSKIVRIHIMSACQIRTLCQKSLQVI